MVIWYILVHLLTISSNLLIGTIFDIGVKNL